MKTGFLSRKHQFLISVLFFSLLTNYSGDLPPSSNKLKFYSHLEFFFSLNTKNRMLSWWDLFSLFSLSLSFYGYLLHCLTRNVFFWHEKSQFIYLSIYLYLNRIDWINNGKTIDQSHMQSSSYIVSGLSSTPPPTTTTTRRFSSSLFLILA